MAGKVTCEPSEASSNGHFGNFLTIPKADLKQLRLFFSALQTPSKVADVADCPTVLTIIRRFTT
jgi:RNA binding exosome subunit